MNRAISLVLLIVGVILVIWGLNASDSFGSSVSKLFTGAPTDKTIWLIVVGIVIGASGLFGMFSSKGN